MATTAASTEVRASWLPLIVVVLTQIQASFAVNALTVSMAGITTDLNTPATTVGTAITASTFAMAAFILGDEQHRGARGQGHAASGVVIAAISPALTVDRKSVV